MARRILIFKSILFGIVAAPIMVGIMLVLGVGGAWGLSQILSVLHVSDHMQDIVVLGMLLLGAASALAYGFYQFQGKQPETQRGE